MTPFGAQPPLGLYEGVCVSILLVPDHPQRPERRLLVCLGGGLVRRRGEIEPMGGQVQLCLVLLEVLDALGVLIHGGAGLDVSFVLRGDILAVRFALTV